MPRTPAFARLVAALTVAACSLSAQPKPAATRVVWPDEGPARWAPRPTVSAITANDLRTRLYGFSDDSMQGRRIGEPGNTRGTDYIAREFKRLGLKPAGDNGSWFQVLAFGPLGYDSSASRLAGPAGPLARGTEWIPMTPNAAGGIGGKVDLIGVPAVFAGRCGIAASASMIERLTAIMESMPTSPLSARRECRSTQMAMEMMRAFRSSGNWLFSADRSICSASHKRRFQSTAL